MARPVGDLRLSPRIALLSALPDEDAEDKAAHADDDVGTAQLLGVAVHLLPAHDGDAAELVVGVQRFSPGPSA